MSRQYRFVSALPPETVLARLRLRCRTARSLWDQYGENLLS